VDRDHFDKLARALASPTSRRSAIALAGRSVVAAFGLRAAASLTARPESVEAAACRANAVTCSQNSQCCSGTCGPKDARGRRSCTCGDTLADPQNCGVCGHVCPDIGAFSIPGCAEGSCTVSCAPGYRRVGDECVPLVLNRQPCTANEQCLGGSCVCRSLTCTEAICASTYPSCSTSTRANLIDGSTDLICGGDSYSWFNCTSTPCPNPEEYCNTGEFCVELLA
jgi:hypothetical protein